MHMRPYRRTQTGFTLIEITVVLVIFGVLLAFAVLGPSRAGRDEVVDRTAAHVSAAIRYLAQDAIFRARPVGLDFSRNAMTPKHYDGEKWHDINDPPLASFEFDADIALEDANGEVHYAQGDPDLIVMPDGTLEIQTLTVRDTVSKYAVVISPAGGVELVTARRL